MKRYAETTGSWPQGQHKCSVSERSETEYEQECSFLARGRALGPCRHDGSPVDATKPAQTLKDSVSGRAKSDVSKGESRPRRPQRP